MSSLLPPQDSPEAGPRRLLPAAVVALFAGLWLLLGAAGLPVPEMGRHWPLIVLLGGVASLIDCVVFSRHRAAAIAGVVAIGAALFFYRFSSGAAQFADIGSWWPWLPAVTAAGLLAGWIAGRGASLPFFAAGALFAGIALSGWGAGRWPLQLVWGGVLVAIGIVFLWRVLAQRN